MIEGTSGRLLLAAFTAAGMLAMSAPAEAASKALVGITPEGDSCFLGGAANGAFVPPEQIVPQLGPNQSYVLVDLGGVIREVASIGAAELTETGDCEASFKIELALEADEPGKFVVALSGDANGLDGLLPKDVRVEQPDDEARETLSTHLRQAGIPEPELSIKQLLTVDLDGDGKSERIINAARIGAEGVAEGDYSVLLVQNEDAVIPIRSDVVTKTSQDEMQALLDNEVVAVIDLDRDGQFEIVSYSAFDYGDGWDAVTIRDGEAAPVLWCGCGG